MDWLGPPFEVDLFSRLEQSNRNGPFEEKVELRQLLPVTVPLKHSGTLTERMNRCFLPPLYYRSGTFPSMLS